MNQNEQKKMKIRNQKIGIIQSPLFEFAFLGNPTSHQMKTLRDSIKSLMRYFKFGADNEIEFFSSSDLSKASYKDKFVAVYFGNDELIDSELAIEILNRGHPIIPVFQSREMFKSQIPDNLQIINGFELEREFDELNREGELEKLATTILESIGLLSHPRKIFISYVREDSREVALQFHKLLTALKFNVFLDTHIIRIGENLNDVLSRHIIGSDVMIVLDKDSYWCNNWTKKEYDIASNRNMSIIQLIWPNRKPEKKCDELVYLKTMDFCDSEMQFLSDEKIKEIIELVEIVRCKSISAQFEYLTESLEDFATMNGAKGPFAGANLSQLIQLSNGEFRCFYPRLGFPTSKDIFEIIRNTDFNEKNSLIPTLVYDNRCYTEYLTKYLEWLNSNLDEIHVKHVSELQ